MVGFPTFLSLLTIFLPLNLSTPPCIHFLSVLYVCILSHFSRVRLCGPVDCSLLGSSVCGIAQARILEWVATPFSRDLPNPALPPCRWILSCHSLPPEPPGKPIITLMISKSLTRSSICHSDWHSCIQQPTWYLPCQLKPMMCKQNVSLTLHLTKQATKPRKHLLLNLDSLSQWICQSFIQVFESKSHVFFYHLYPLPPLIFQGILIFLPLNILFTFSPLPLLLTSFRPPPWLTQNTANSLIGLPAFNIVSLFSPFLTVGPEWYV